MFRQVDIERETAQYQRRGNSRDQDSREQRSNDHVEQVVAGVDGRNADYDADQDVDHARARHVVVHGFADMAHGNPPRQIGHGGQADEGGK